MVCMITDPSKSHVNGVGARRRMTVRLTKDCRAVAGGTPDGR